MPAFTFTSPEGKSYTVNGPDGATKEQAFQILQGQIGAQKPAGQAPAILPEIGGGIADAVKSGVQSVAGYLNPFSEARHQSYAQQAQAPIGEALKENLGQIGGTGSALVAPFTTAGNVANSVAAPLVAHPFQALNQSLGVDLPYDQARSQAELALSGMRPAAASPVGPTMVKPPPLPSSDLKAAGSAVFNDPAVKFASVPVDQLTNKVTQAGSELLNQGFRPTPESAPATFRELNNLVPSAPKPVDRWTALEAEMNGQPVPIPEQPIKNVTVDDIRAARRALGKTAGQKTFDGKATPDAQAATQAIGHLDDLLSGMAPDLATANANYSAGLAGDATDFRQIMADRRAAKTGSGTNIENTMRQEADKIPNRGLQPDEQQLKDQIVTGTRTRNALRRIGKLGFGDGLSLTQQLIATPLTGGANLIVGVPATAARKIGEALTRRQIGQLSEAIRSRAPASQAQPMVPQQLTTRAKLAALLAGQRALPAGGPVPAYADQNQ